MSRKTFLAASLAVFCGTEALRSDEGMWLYNDPPRERVRAKYGFELTDAWLEHLQKSSVRFNSGGSGSFVSEDGLVLSNHHVGADALQKVSSAQKNYLRDGFYARSQAEEIPCVDLELNVLQSIVAAQVRATTWRPTPRAMQQRAMQPPRSPPPRCWLEALLRLRPPTPPAAHPPMHSGTPPLVSLRAPCSRQGCWVDWRNLDRRRACRLCWISSDP
jgi:hypothetical protein